MDLLETVKKSYVWALAIIFETILKNEYRLQDSKKYLRIIYMSGDSFDISFNYNKCQHLYYNI